MAREPRKPTYLLLHPSFPSLETSTCWALSHTALSTPSPEKYGPLMLLYLGRIPTLIVSSAEMAEQIMKTHDLIFASRPSITAAKELFYGCTDVAFASYGEYWRQVRKMCVARASKHQESQLVPFNHGRRRISHSSSTGAAVNLAELFLSLTSGSIARAALGKKYEGEGEEGRNKSCEGVGDSAGAFSVGDYFPSLAWVDVVTGLHGKLKENSGELDRFLDQVIEHHLMRPSDGCDVGEQRDFVDVMLQVQKDSNRDIHLTRDNIKATILDMFTGGTNTSAFTLEWVMAELAKHPNVMEKAQGEVRRVLDVKANISEEHLYQLNYMKSIIKETLRLHPPIPLLIPRESTTNVMIQNLHIPPKTRVFINAYAIGRDPTSWENPEEFLPERFANNSIDFKGQDFQFIPFGAGRRGCPGLSFAITSLELALANLLYWFDWKLPQGLTEEDLDMSEAFGFTVHKKLPLYLVPKHHFS
ncbi:LOW QUALITY PROTEIN: Cytochrome P450 71A1 [Cinnamomum micranthum f. kanehirae]|uniref:Cytochrome P450 71A1 n=1 Tax=Cinnamomum micranthum f. kanehirae TaxID=337451 RepID=A0A443NBS7_9MAGN|nr:LOW QUALITY PROTEIN: Cytochrome P450 71A1 [Cinnamomum micranthum f. kanehirae]